MMNQLNHVRDQSNMPVGLLINVSRYKYSAIDILVKTYLPSIYMVIPHVT